MAGSGSLSSLWKISLSLLMVSQCHLHTSIILYFQCYQTTGLNIFCETLLGFWGRQRLRWLNDITDSRDLKVKVAQSCGTLCDLMDYIQSVEFSRPECWSGQLFPSPGDLLSPGIEPRSPALQADSLPAEPPGKPQWT